MEYICRVWGKQIKIIGWFLEMEKKNKKKLSYNNDKTGKGGGRAHEKSISINPTAGNDLKI